jgi:Cu-Zn family superoxide dismutase
MRTVMLALGASLSWMAAACGGGATEQAPEMAESPAVASPPPAAEPAEPPAPEGVHVEVAFAPKSGSKLSGKATLVDVGDGVKVTLEIQGISPGKHGAHVHEKADCSADDGTSAGGHFNPAGHEHGLPDGTRHLGDLGNIEIKADGTGTLEAMMPGANLKAGDPSSFLDRAIIVHEKEDDGGQPTGNAGGRVGCAEIKAP